MSLSFTYPIMALEENVLGLVPVTIFHRTLEVRSMMSIQVGEDPVLVLQTSIHPLWRVRHGSEATALLLRGLPGAACGEASCGSYRWEDAVGDAAQGLLAGRVSGNHCGVRVRDVRRAIDLAGSLVVVGRWR
jgi:hypothetical protein